MVRGPVHQILGADILKYAENTPVEFETALMHSNGMPVQVIRFREKMDVLSSAVCNGGHIQTDCILIMQVPKDYICEDPVDHVMNVIDDLGLPKETVGLMTAAEIEYVFNVVHHEYKGYHAYAAATAGLSNQVVAGDELTDWDARHEISVKREKAMYGKYPGGYRAGTINTVAILDRSLSLAGKANAIIAATEAKSAAMWKLGYSETGTTSDAIAIVTPAGEELCYAGTGSYNGLAMARSVRDAVCKALIIRDDFPIGIEDDRRQRIREEYGL